MSPHSTKIRQRITQINIQANHRSYPACAINSSIKEKTDMIPIISTAP